MLLSNLAYIRYNAKFLDVIMCHLTHTHARTHTYTDLAY